MCKDQKQEFLIDNKVVDVSRFTRRHPGGGIIRYMIGTEATDSFNAFHVRSKKARVMLKALPSREATAEDLSRFQVTESDVVIKEFEALRQQLKDEGFYDPDYLHIAYRIFEVAALIAFGGYLAVQYWESSILITILGLVIAGIGQGRCGWLMHEGGHCSLTGNIPVDWNLQRFFYGFGCGMSARWWRIQHNKHHATPQKLKHDPDHDTLPLVAFCKEVAKKATNPLMKRWISVQNYLFIPVTCLLVGLGWQLFLHPRCIIRKKEWTEAFWMGLRYVLAGYLNHYYWGWGYGTVAYLFSLWIACSYIFVNFAVSHTHLPIVPKDKHINWVAYSAYHTMDVSHAPWCNWWMAYLNFQIEHHLFPSMPQYRFPQVAPRVKAFFKKHGYPYLYANYWDAMRTTFANLESVGHFAG